MKGGEGQDMGMKKRGERKGTIGSKP